MDMHQLEMEQAEKSKIKLELEQMRRYTTPFQVIFGDRVYFIRSQSSLASQVHDARSGASIAQQRAVQVEAAAQEANRRLSESSQSLVLLEQRLDHQGMALHERETQLEEAKRMAAEQTSAGS